MKLTFTLNSEAEENLLDLGIDYRKDGDNLVVDLPLSDDDWTLIEGLWPDELAEFFGIQTEFLVHMEVFE